MATQDQNYRAGESKGRTQEKSTAREMMGRDRGQNDAKEAKNKPYETTQAGTGNTAVDKTEAEAADAVKRTLGVGDDFPC